MLLEEVKQKFFKFFNKFHLIESSPIVNEKGDTLFVIAGIVQFSDWLLNGKAKYNRVISCQKCIRTCDIDLIGYSDYHFTYFEMLGVFYFDKIKRKNSIKLILDFLTQELMLFELKITVAKNDVESIEILSEIFSNKFEIKEDNENQWKMGDYGPFGYCLEIFYKNLEIGTIVFIDSYKNLDGSIINLKYPCVDIGIGLERLCSVLQNKSFFEIDTISPILQYIKSISKNYKSVDAKIIIDHSRAIFNMMLENITPSNEGRGYILRRLIRRSYISMLRLGIDISLLSNICKINNEVLQDEEIKFQEILNQAEKIINKNIENNFLSCKNVFKLYETHGIPIEISKEICRLKSINIDISNLDFFIQQHQKRSKTKLLIKKITQTQFLGYDKLELKSVVLNIDHNNIVFNQTPFYSEAGGQVADKGKIYNENFEGYVEDVQKNIHKIKIIKGDLKIGDEVKMIVDKNRRDNITKHHSATHILHSILKSIFGEKVTQAGSLVDEDRFRFDFYFNRNLTNNEIDIIENRVNQVILNKSPVIIEIENEIRTVHIGEISVENCCGTHVKNSNDILFFKIINFTSLSSNVKRIEAVCGINVKKYFSILQTTINNLSKKINCNYENLIIRIDQILNENHIFKKRIVELEIQLLVQQLNSNEKIICIETDYCLETVKKFIKLVSKSNKTVLVFHKIFKNFFLYSKVDYIDKLKKNNIKCGGNRLINGKCDSLKELYDIIKNENSTL